MKKIRVKAVLNKDKRTFDLHVLEQTHYGSYFGGDQECTRGSAEGPFAFVHSNGVMLGAWHIGPSVMTYLGGGWTSCYKAVNFGVIFSHRSENTMKGKNIVKGILVERWPAIKEAVEAYNEFYKNR